MKTKKWCYFILSYLQSPFRRSHRERRVEGLPCKIQRKKIGCERSAYSQHGHPPFWNWLWSHFLAYPTLSNLHNATVYSHENNRKDGLNSHPCIPNLSTKSYKPGTDFALKNTLLNELTFLCSVWTQNLQSHINKNHYTYPNEEYSQQICVPNFLFEFYFFFSYRS